MGRLSLRIAKKVNADVLSSDGKERSVGLKDIGLGGVLLESKGATPAKWLASGSLHSLRIHLAGIGEVTPNTVVARNEKTGIGLRFQKVGRGDLLKIWQFIRDHAVQDEKCPYCGKIFEAPADQCPHCRWKLTYQNNDYFDYWEREALLRGIRSQLNSMKIEGLRQFSGILEEQKLIPQKTPSVDDTEEFVGTCPAMKQIFGLIRKVSPTDLPVLVLGESGTGKELTARAIHERSTRSSGPFVAINCAAIPEHLLESELFGHSKGAFTGAYKGKKGKFELAHQGTLFLDEIGEFPLNLQPKLLRVLENQNIERIGSRKKTPVDVRVLAATNRNLDEAVAQGLFRPDLYFRIKVFTIQLPPLREREEDKVVLAEYFFKKIKMERDWECKGFSAEALKAIRENPWPGNVRELINRIRRAVVVQNQWITPEDLELDPGAYAVRKTPLKTAKDQLKKEMIQNALKTHHYNITQTARFLGISRQHLYLLKKKLNIVIPSNRKFA